MKTPYIPQDVVDFLDSQYPERTPEPSWGEREIWIKVGERRVVRKLKALKEEEVEKNLIRTK